MASVSSLLVLFAVSSNYCLFYWFFIVLPFSCFDDTLICFEMPLMFIFFPKHAHLSSFLLPLLCFKCSACICIALTFHNLFVVVSATVSGLLVGFFPTTYQSGNRVKVNRIPV